MEKIDFYWSRWNTIKAFSWLIFAVNITSNFRNYHPIYQ